MTIAERLADYVLSFDGSEASGPARDNGRTHYIDGMACMLLGAHSASVEAAKPYVWLHNGREDSVFPDREKSRMDSIYAAMLGAIAAHSNDFDDMSTSLNGHPSALLVPVTFALGQKLHASGKEVLNAYMAGVEVDAILGRAMLDVGYRKGWNTTCVVGIFGATAAAGLLLKLDRKQLAAALCIAVNEASGFKANFGTKAKDLAIGMAAVKAITAAECAKNGMDASPDAFEGPFGFFQSMLGQCDTGGILRSIAQHEPEFVSPGLVMKPYPSCRGNHCAIGCITKLVSRYSFAPQDVSRIVCLVDSASYDTDRYRVPVNPGQAKFSLAFCVAKVVVSGGIAIQDFMGSEIADKAALDFCEKIEIICRPELFPESRYGTQVEVELKNGQCYKEKECFAKGDPLYPMSSDEVLKKLTQCLTFTFGEDKAEKAAEALLKFEQLADIGDVLEAL